MFAPEHDAVLALTLCMSLEEHLNHGRPNAYLRTVFFRLGAPVGVQADDAAVEADSLPHQLGYAFEELVAELGSAFLCARLGIAPSFRSASYIDSSLKVLKGDNRAIFSAASYAGHAADWLWKEAFPEAPSEDFRQAAE